MNTFHSLATPMYHGNLNSLNVFVEVGADVPKIVVGEIEMNDFKRYANMFYSYRSVSVSSAPECLKNPKKRLDPTSGMDTYSFSMIMWELLHDKQPFDGNLDAAIEFVIDQDARPMIVTHSSSNKLESGTLGDINEQ